MECVRDEQLPSGLNFHSVLSAAECSVLTLVGGTAHLPEILSVALNGDRVETRSL